MNRLGLVGLAGLVLAASACSNETRDDHRGLPPAKSWQPPAANAAAAAGMNATANPHGGMGMQNPHGGMGMGMGDPHAGLDMNNPHAGLDMNNPHGGMGMGDPHAGLDMNNPHAGLDMGDAGVDVMQLGLEPPDPERDIDLNKYLRGTLKPAAETKARIPIGSVIFFSVKSADASGQPTGAPLAVKRMVVAGWPMFFDITEADAMVSGTQFQGDVVVSAWSDGDQDAISKQPGDVQGSVKATIPARELTLVLDSVVE